MAVIRSVVASAALLLGAPQLALAQQSEAAGFLEDSRFSVINRNFYYHRNFRSEFAPANYREEWAHGVVLDYKSGYTQGTIGFGLDAHSFLGIKLDGSRGRSPNLVLPVDGQGNPEEQFAELGGALKLRVSNTELKYGDLMPITPVFAISNYMRLFPATTRGFQLTSSDISGLNLEAGHFTAGNDVNSTNSDGPLKAFYAKRETDRVDYLGGWYKVGERLKFGAFASNFEDIWNQYYLSANYTWPIGEGQTLNALLTAYHTDEEGQANAGKIDNTTWSASLAYSSGAHKVTLSRQQVHGDEPFDYLGFASMPGDAIGFLANKSQNADFNLPNERSWQLRYDVDMSAFGVPGLTLMARYLTSDGIDGSDYYGGGAYAKYMGVSDGGRWERDLEAKYVVQSGPAKDLSFRIRQATLRADASVQRVDLPSLDEVRVIIEYPLSF